MPPAVINAAGLLVMLLLVVTLALHASQAQPPNIAEFAPQVQHEITKAPSQQSGALGTGEGTGGGGGGGGQPSPSPPSGPPPIYFHCVGDPPRQILDPQSPPCVPSWQGNNGGSTTAGVTGKIINLAVYGQQSGGTVNNDLQNFFNSHMELYGRQIRLNPTTWNINADCSSHESFAVDDKAKLNPFAVFGNMDYGEYTDCYAKEAAKLGMIEMSGNGGTNAWLQQNSPYLWRYGASFDDEFRAFGEWACKALAGHPASFATDPNLVAKTRKFGLIIQHEQEPYPFDGSALRQELAACGQSLLEDDMTLAYSGTDNGYGEAETDARNAISDMQSNGVTTLYCFCRVFVAPLIEQAAENDNYYPEWVMGGQVWDDLSVKLTFTDPSERKSLMLVDGYEDEVPYQDDPLSWALGADAFQNQAQNFVADEEVYETLLMIVSGIQMAGPHLTPQSFKQGLQTTAFPNPFNWLGSGRVGFPGDYTMEQDFQIAWWSETPVAPLSDDGNGAWCYVDQGKRWPLGGMPNSTFDLFRGTCNTDPPTVGDGG